MKRAAAATLFIFGVILIDVLGLSILMPVSAYIVREYSADALAVSMLTVIYAAAQIIAAPILGRLSDRHGRRPVLLICVLGSAVGYFIFGVGGALWVLFLSRLIDGITGGNFSVANAYIADVTPPEDRAKRFALVGAAFGTGFVLGPALGGMLSRISLEAPAYAAGVLSLVNFVVGLALLPESLPIGKRNHEPLRPSELTPFASIAAFARRPEVGLFLLVYALFQFVFTGNTSVFQVFAIDRFGVPPTALATIFTVSGASNLVVQGFLIRPLVHRFGERALLTTGLAGQAAMLIATFLVPAFWMLYPVVLLGTAFNGLIWPTLTAFISNAVPQHEQGSISGTTLALAGLMSVFGPFSTGLLYDNLGYVAPFVCEAGVILVAWGMMMRRGRRGNEDNEDNGVNERD